MYNVATEIWSVKAETLPHPIYEQGCIKTTSKITGNPIILLAGGLIQHNITSVKN